MLGVSLVSLDPRHHNQSPYIYMDFDHNYRDQLKPLCLVPHMRSPQRTAHHAPPIEQATIAILQKIWLSFYK